MSTLHPAQGGEEDYTSMAGEEQAATSATTIPRLELTSEEEQALYSDADAEGEDDDGSYDDDDDTPLALNAPIMSGLRPAQQDHPGREEQAVPTTSTTPILGNTTSAQEQELSCDENEEPEEEEEEEEGDEEYDDDEDEGEIEIEYEPDPFKFEAEALYQAVPVLRTIYRVTEKLGEGTFSTVYKAQPLLAQPRREMKGYYYQGQGNAFVALKRIYVSSSPARIVNELDILEELRNNVNISHLVNVFRHRDQVIAVMSYNEHADFRDYYRVLPMSDIRCYFRALFSALAATHKAKIIHRDVKPANFLYNPHTGHGTLCDFGLAERFDPEEWKGKCHHTCPDERSPHGEAKLNGDVPSSVYAAAVEAANASASASASAGGAGGAARGNGKSVLGALGPGSEEVGGEGTEVHSAQPAQKSERVGYLREDTRQPVRANRAGTRGFRAPEVLLKCQDQTVALDIWSAGVILLSMLTKRFPMFNADDDVIALLELGVLFGRRRMDQCAMFHNRTFKTDIPDITEDGFRMGDFVKHLNPEIFEDIGSGYHESSSASSSSMLGKRPLGENVAPSQRRHEGAAERELERRRRNADRKRHDLAGAIDLVKVCLNPIGTKRWDADRILKHRFFAVSAEEDEEVEKEEEEEEKVVKRVKRVLL
ncbi:hypothetical protein A4X09_0g2330 [Tilletia walkeri]|uniref:non-specific serine/threonine protein kinase n=1 Tax=Tilletia walkeri TaxID=117179 RepID=A0A8X7NA49_9BASI|nr:hypothetical protein A4X09_0g2330 [Tilletia walkeri]